MQKRFLVAMGTVVASLFSMLAPVSGRAQNSGPAALTGQITSQEEGPMEGVVVSAKGADTNITISVVSDDKGRYSCPKSRLKPNKYAVSIRAVGYEIGSPSNFEPAPKPLPQYVPDKHTPAALVPVEVAANKTVQLDLKLVKTTDLASQLSKAEWIMSVPGTEAERRLISGNGCGFCHSLERVVKSKYDEAAFFEVVKRMDNYAGASFPMRPVPFPKEFVRHGFANYLVDQETMHKTAKYLSMINLGAGRTQWTYQLKTLPRPKGEGTKVIYTEYDLPRRAAEPHDAAVDSEGIVWYSDHGSMNLGRLNPRTGEVKEWPVPVLKPTAPQVGFLSVSFDKQGNVWIGSLYQAAIYKFDKKTEKFTSYPAPGEYNNNDTRSSMTAPENSDVDGKVWFDNAQGNQVMHRLDLATGKIETVKPFGEGDQAKGHSLYGIASDSKNNLVYTDYVGSGMAMIDAKTLKVSGPFPTPTPNARPRRLSLDSQGRAWFGENTVNKIGMFDPKTKEFKEWEMPTPWTDPYDAMMDKNGEVWTSGMVTDRVVRLDPKTGKTVEYLLPRPTQTRRVFVDNSVTPVAFWLGSNLGASIVKVESLK